MTLSHDSNVGFSPSIARRVGRGAPTRCATCQLWVESAAPRSLEASTQTCPSCFLCSLQTKSLSLDSQGVQSHPLPIPHLPQSVPHTVASCSGQLLWEGFLWEGLQPCQQQAPLPGPWAGPSLLSSSSSVPYHGPVRSSERACDLPKVTQAGSGRAGSNPRPPALSASGALFLGVEGTPVQSCLSLTAAVRHLGYVGPASWEKEAQRAPTPAVTHRSHRCWDSRPLCLTHSLGSGRDRAPGC